MTGPAAEVLQKAGDVIIDEVALCNLDGVAVNATAQVFRIDLFESIYSPFLTGTIFLFDGIDIRTLLNISGKEILRIRYHTPVIDSKGKELEFFIFRCSEKIQIREKMQGYSLDFISKEAVVNSNSKISKLFKGNASSIARDILGDSGLQTSKPVTVEETSTDLAFVSNFWQPTRCMRYLMEHCVSKDKSPDMLFYEDTNGFNFRSLRSLVGKDVPTVAEFKKQTQDNSVQPDKLKADINNVPDDFTHFSAIREKTGFDYFERLKNGFYGGEIIGYDSTSHQYTYNKFSRKFDEDEHLNEFPPLGENSRSSTRGMLLYQPKRYNTFEGFEDVTNYLYAINRKTIFERLRTTAVVLEVPGRSDYYVGMKVNLKIPRSIDQQNPNNTIEDIHSSGTYLVCKIKHSIFPQDHRCTLELTKDSYIHSLDVPPEENGKREEEPKRDDSISVPEKIATAVAKKTVEQKAEDKLSLDEYYTDD